MSTNLELETEQSSTPVNPKLNQEPQTFNHNICYFSEFKS